MGCTGTPTGSRRRSASDWTCWRWRGATQPNRSGSWALARSSAIGRMNDRAFVGRWTAGTGRGERGGGTQRSRRGLARGRGARRLRGSKGLRALRQTFAYSCRSASMGAGLATSASELHPPHPAPLAEERPVGVLAGEGEAAVVEAERSYPCASLPGLDVCLWMIALRTWQVVRP